MRLGNVNDASQWLMFSHCRRIKKEKDKEKRRKRKLEGHPSGTPVFLYIDDVLCDGHHHSRGFQLNPRLWIVPSFRSFSQDACLVFHVGKWPVGLEKGNTVRHLCLSHN